MKEDLLKIIKHYGVNHQQRKLNEEVFELQEAILKAEYYIPRKDDSFTKINCNLDAYVNHITEEIADVMVMLGQFVSYYKIDNDSINEIMSQKIERQLKRMEEESNGLNK